MKKIKELWKKFCDITKSNAFIFSFPAIALALIVAFPYRFLAFCFIVVWCVVIINNTDDEKG